MDSALIKRNIKKYLKERHGDVKPEWYLIIDLLVDNVVLYEQVMSSIEENGIYDKDTKLKNPLLSTAKDLQATIMKQIQHLGISPYAYSRIKQETEDDTVDFVEALTGGAEE